MAVNYLSLTILASFLVILVIWIYRYLKDTYSLLKRLNIPGPQPIWILGNAADFKHKHPLEVFKAWRKRYGDIYGFYEGFRAGIVINNPEFSQQILSKHFDKFNIRTPYLPFTYFPDDLSLIKSVGEKWKTQRSIISKTLNVTASVQQVVDKVQHAATHLLWSLEDMRLESPDGFDISELINRCTVNANGSIVLGMDIESQTEELKVALEYARAFKNSASADNPLAGISRLFPGLTPVLQSFDTEHRSLHTQMKSIVSQQVQRLKPNTHLKVNNNNNKDDGNERVELKADMLAHMMGAVMNVRLTDGSVEKRPITDEELTMNAMQLFSETFQTLVNCMSFVVYELAMNPDHQNRVFEELSSSIGSQSKGELTLSELQTLTYLDMFVYETLRLHPVAPGISRTCSEDCTINNVQFKKGMVVRLMMSTLYDDDTIFPDSATFDPERFSKGRRQERHPYSFLPFGKGPRSCPGSKMALIQIKTIILRILQKYIITPCSATEVPLATALRPSLCPANGVHIKLIPRNH